MNGLCFEIPEKSSSNSQRVTNKSTYRRGYYGRFENNFGKIKTAKKSGILLNKLDDYTAVHWFPILYERDPTTYYLNHNIENIVLFLLILNKWNNNKLFSRITTEKKKRVKNYLYTAKRALTTANMTKYKIIND